MQKIINKYIGGFFERALPEGIVDMSILSAWGVGHDVGGFINARSALSALLKHLNISRVLLPAYSCMSLMDACSGHHVKFYPLTKSLDPDVTILSGVAKPGDAILAINYFGKAPSKQFLEFLRQHKDIIFIEDCAQSLSTGIPPWGDWRLFSPRKLVGVADGGFIVPEDENDKSLAMDLIQEGSVNERWAAAQLRFEDKEGAFNSLWHSANQKHEAARTVKNEGMSNLSYDLLSKLDIASIVQRRKNNYKALYSVLSNWSLLKDGKPNYAPFGFPIRVPQAVRDRLVTALIEDNIFPAIHWRDLPSPESDFKFEHQLSKEVVTLPCDQRYKSEDMDYIATSVHRFFERSF